MCVLDHHDDEIRNKLWVDQGGVAGAAGVGAPQRSDFLALFRPHGGLTSRIRLFISFRPEVGFGTSRVRLSRSQVIPKIYFLRPGESSLFR